MHIASIVTGSWQSLASVSVVALAVAVALHVAKLGAEAGAWHGIVRHAHVRNDVRFRTTLGAFVTSIGPNALLPARVGEACRVGALRRRVPGSSIVTISATVMLETGIEVAFGAAVIATVLIAGWYGPAGSTAVPSALVRGATVVGAILCAALVLGLLGLLNRERVLAVVSRLGEGLSIVRAPRTFVARVLCWKVLAWGLRIGSVYAFLLAFNVPAAPWTALAVVAAQNVAAFVPLLPGNAGTQQASIGVALAGTASAATVLGFGVGMQAATTLADVVLGGAVLLLVANRQDLRRALGRRRARPATV